MNNSIIHVINLKNNILKINYNEKELKVICSILQPTTFTIVDKGKIYTIYKRYGGLKTYSLKEQEEILLQKSLHNIWGPIAKKEFAASKKRAPTYGVITYGGYNTCPR